MADRIIYINVETMQEEPAVFIEFVAPFKAKIKTQYGKILVIDIDDMWADPEFVQA